MSASASVRDETVDVWDGRLRLHVKVAGDGPPLVFFHPLSGLAWNPFLDQLATRHTVYAPEHPGTSPGDPRAIDQVQTFWELLLCYEELLRGLGLDRPAVVGQSYGGMVAADLAANFPLLFSRLVLLSPAGLWRDDAPIPLMEMVAGPPEDLPRYLFAHPESAAAQAAMAPPADPALIPAAIAQQAWNVGCTTKFAWPIADHGLGRRLAPGRRADARRLGPPGRADLRRLRGGLRPADRGQPGRGHRRLRARAAGRPARGGRGGGEQVPGRVKAGLSAGPRGSTPTTRAATAG